MNTRPDVRVARLAAEQHGVLSVEELRDRGLSHKAVLDRVRAGWLHPVYRGVYAVGHAGIPHEGRFLAAVKACGPGAVLSTSPPPPSTSFSTGMIASPRSPRPRSGGIAASACTAPRCSTFKTSRATKASRSRRPPAPSSTSPPRSTTERYGAVVREAQRRLVTIRQLTATLDRLGPRRGVTKLNRILATGHAPTRSELEDAVLDLILAGGLEHPHVNRPLTIQGRRIIPDFRWPEQRLVIEADGAEWHEDRVARQTTPSARLCWRRPASGSCA